MKRYAETAQCIGVDRHGSLKTRCVLEATYIIVDRGPDGGKVPMACTYPGHYYGSIPQSRRIGPLYCRSHAYLLCGKAPPGS